MTIRHRRILAATAAAGLLAVSAPASAAAPLASSTTTSPATAAAGWLAQQFGGAAGDHFDFAGSATFDGGRTSDAIYALAAAKSGRVKIDAATTYFEHHIKDYVDLTGVFGGPFDGGVAKAALAAIVAGADPTSFGTMPDKADPTHVVPVNLLQILKDDECKAPATGCTLGSAASIFSSISESLVILVRARAAGVYAPTPDGIAYFLSLQCPNGGFTDLTSACTDNAAAAVDQTAYAAAALEALGDHPAELARAKDWLLSQRAPGGYWVAQGGPNADSTGLAASALDEAGIDTSTSRAWLASQQVTSGPTVGAGASRGALKFQGAFDASLSIKATADGLLGMVSGVSLATLTADGATPGTSVLALEQPRFSSASVNQGARQTLTGPGFAANEKVSAVLHSVPVPLGAVSSNKSGTAIVTFTVPATLAAGTHQVVLTGATSGLSSTASFIVTAAPVAPGSSAPSASNAAGGQVLANSGLDGQQALLEGLIGLGLVLVGAAALYMGRRRRS
ncbi:MAG: hypothetical protein M3Y44_03085 [Actinomycetota bacterium]|nr:hypothetical protein [Actinomycetota bacterium]